MHCALKYTAAILLLAGSGWVRAGEDALFWSIETAEGHAGYLLGTIHSEDPRVLEFSPAFLARLSGSQVFAMELVPDLPTLARLQSYMRLGDGEHLAGRIGEARFETLVRALAAYGVSREQASAMKPWAAMMTLSVPRPRTGLFMDLALSLRAQGNGLRLAGLETLEEQLSFLENMSPGVQMELLDHALANFAHVDEVHERMVDIYLGGDLRALVSETDAQMAGLATDTRQWFMREGIDARNRRMLASLLAELDGHTVFAAVGALHLPGEQGLVALLRGAGYRLTPMPLPFASVDVSVQEALNR